MKTSKIGDLNLLRFKTEFHATLEIRKLLERNKISLATLIPQAWLWYDTELLEVIDENGDGKPDNKFGKDFKVIYYSSNKAPLSNEETRKLEKEALFISKISIKNLTLKYATIENS